MSGDSVSPGQYGAGPERDAAIANRAAYHRWLRESQEPEARAYRAAAAQVAMAKIAQAGARRQALAAFKRKLRSGGSA